MDLSNDLASVLRRQAVKRVERVTDARVQKRRFVAARDHAQAVNEDRADASPIEPTAIFDNTREKDLGHLIDLVV